MEDIERHKDKLLKQITELKELSSRLLIIEGTMVATME